MLFCDNATTFVGARNELSKSIKQMNTCEVICASRRYNIEWKFNVPKASHQAGVVERLIRTIRRVLSALLHPNARLTDDTFVTFLCEVESVINSRPISKVSDDVDDSAALTPNHMLLLDSNVPVPLGMFHDADVYRRRWRHVQYMTNLFWKRWIAEYLPMLQSRQKWHRVRDNVKVNDVMLIMDDNAPRGCWPLGVVVDVNRSRDNLVRSVRLRSRGKFVVRPLTKVVFLEGARDD